MPIMLHRSARAIDLHNPVLAHDYLILSLGLIQIHEDTEHVCIGSAIILTYAFESIDDI